MSKVEIFNQSNYSVMHSWPDGTEYIELGECSTDSEIQEAIERIKNKKAIALNGYDSCCNLWWEGDIIYAERFHYGYPSKSIISLEEAIELIKEW